MKLFTRYNRIILLIMVLVFLLSSIFFYFSLNYILIGEVDGELSYRKAKMERYVRQTGNLPRPDGLGDIQVTYTLDKQRIVGDQYSLVNLYDSSENNIGVFRKIVFTLPVQKQIYRVTVVRPLEEHTNSL